MITACKPASLAIKDVIPHVFGSVALALMVVEVAGTCKGKSASGAIDFFIKRDGRRQALYSQNTTVQSR